MIGNNVTIYHGVTIGARSYTTKKRHPTIKDNVIIGCHAILLGNITIGENSKIGADATVTKDIPHNTVQLFSINLYTRKIIYYLTISLHWIFIAYIRSYFTASKVDNIFSCKFMKS